MKTWKHLTFVAFLAVFGIIVTFSGCDNGIENNDPKCDCTETIHDKECTCKGIDCNCTIAEPDPIPECDCPNGTVYYDEECSCDASNCNCMSEYKPVFETLFVFLASVDTSPNDVRTQTQTTYNAIWATNPQLILRLKNAVTIKESPIDVGYADYDISEARIEFLASVGRIRVAGPIPDADFTALFEAALEDCVAFYLQE